MLTKRDQFWPDYNGDYWVILDSNGDAVDYISEFEQAFESEDDAWTAIDQAEIQCGRCHGSGMGLDEKKTATRGLRVGVTGLEPQRRQQFTAATLTSRPINFGTN